MSESSAIDGALSLNVAGSDDWFISQSWSGKSPKLVFRVGFKWNITVQERERGEK